MFLDLHFCGPQIFVDPNLIFFSQILFGGNLKVMSRQGKINVKVKSKQGQGNIKRGQGQGKVKAMQAQPQPKLQCDGF